MFMAPLCGMSSLDLFRWCYRVSESGTCISGPVQHVGMNVSLGENVRLWHFTYIGDDSVIGDNTKIGSLVHIDYDVRIGCRTPRPRRCGPCSRGHTSYRLFQPGSQLFQHPARGRTVSS